MEHTGHDNCGPLLPLQNGTQSIMNYLLIGGSTEKTIEKQVTCTQWKNQLVFSTVILSFSNESHQADAESKIA